MAVSGEIRLTDGRTVLLRTAGPADVPAVARLLAGLSPESFRRRFQGGRPAPDLVARLARIDSPPGTACVVAATAAGPGRLAAEARYVPAGAGTAELALTVLDDYQGAGLGPHLLDALAERAGAAGIERLRAVVSLDNAPMLHLLGRYGWAMAEATDACSVATLEIAAAGGMPGWPRAVAGQRILVERRGWYDDQRTAALRAAGNDVRQCTGPRRAGRPCALLAVGRCRLAEEADRIVALLPGDDADCAAVTAAHRQRWPDKLAK